jgi:hypothetical protein
MSVSLAGFLAFATPTDANSAATATKPRTLRMVCSIQF